MENVNISKIDSTVPNALAYVRKINSWDENGDFNIKKDEKLIPFYAIYFGDLFLAASVVELDKENSKAKIDMINGSIFDREVINQEATRKLTSMINDDYGINNIEVNHIKKLSHI